MDSSIGYLDTGSLKNYVPKAPRPLPKNIMEDSTGRYFHVDKNLGSGAFGQVFAVSENLKNYALKIFKGDKSLSENLTEIDVLYRINNPSLIKGIEMLKFQQDYGTLEDLKVGSMEGFQKESVLGGDDELYNVKTKFVEQILGGMACLEKMGFLNIDVKPANMLYSIESEDGLIVTSDDINFFISDYGACIPIDYPTQIVDNAPRTRLFLPIIENREFRNNQSVWAFGISYLYIFYKRIINRTYQDLILHGTNDEISEYLLKSINICKDWERRMLIPIFTNHLKTRYPSELYSGQMECEGKVPAFNLNQDLYPFVEFIKNKNCHYRTACLYLMLCIRYFSNIGYNREEDFEILKDLLHLAETFYGESSELSNSRVMMLLQIFECCIGYNPLWKNAIGSKIKDLFESIIYKYDVKERLVRIIESNPVQKSKNSNRNLNLNPLLGLAITNRLSSSIGRIFGSNVTQ